jgi:drug/metabolite transporter (DMT)-like permease
LILLSRSFPQALRPDWHFWFLGAGFLLIENTIVTRLALLFGTTWLVNALAISGVLIMILAANLLVLKSQHINLRWVYAFLFLSFVLVYFFPLDWFNQFHPVLRASSMIFLSLPLFFSGIIFSESIKRWGKCPALGGEFERVSVWRRSRVYFPAVGRQSLYFTAIIYYWPFSLL